MSTWSSDAASCSKAMSTLEVPKGPTSMEKGSSQKTHRLGSSTIEKNPTGMRWPWASPGRSGPCFAAAAVAEGIGSMARIATGPFR